jgi:hypothetical protein
MVEFSDAAADPEAVVVKFPYAAVAVPAVATPVWLDYLADFTEAL